MVNVRVLRRYTEVNYAVNFKFFLCAQRAKDLINDKVLRRRTEVGYMVNVKLLRGHTELKI